MGFTSKYGLHLLLIFCSCIVCKVLKQPPESVGQYAALSQTDFQFCSALAHCVSHIKGMLPSRWITSPFRESVGCQHVNISAIPSIKYHELLACLCVCVCVCTCMRVDWLRLPSVKPSNLQGPPFPFANVALREFCWIVSRYFKGRQFYYTQGFIFHIKFKLFCCLVHWISSAHRNTRAPTHGH